MPSNLPLLGKTVVLTGTSKTASVIEDIKLYGGNGLVYPLIETREIIDSLDAIQLEAACQFDWLIFTSQNAVEAFHTKMKRLNNPNFKVQGKIAAVGSKTASALEGIGFEVSFMPSTYSADVFVREFPLIAGDSPNCLFLRGSKARDTVKKSLPFLVEEWTVYETVEKYDNVKPLIDVICQQDDVTIIFASPSAVNVFAQHVAPHIDLGKVLIATIGHVTTAALEGYGVNVHIQPKEYTMQAVLAQLLKLEEI